MKTQLQTRKAAARKAAHVPPLGLQITARLLDPDADRTYIKKNLAAADQSAARLLSDPLITLEDDGAAFAVAELANTLGAEKAAQRIADVIPESATYDPQAWIMDAICPYTMATRLLYLCIGYRIGRMYGGQDRAR
jgi:hypothetical protein